MWTSCRSSGLPVGARSASRSEAASTITLLGRGTHLRGGFAQVVRAVAVRYHELAERGLVIGRDGRVARVDQVPELVLLIDEPPRARRVACDAFIGEVARQKAQLLRLTRILVQRE